MARPIVMRARGSPAHSSTTASANLQISGCIRRVSDPTFSSNSLKASPRGLSVAEGSGGLLATSLKSPFSFWSFTSWSFLAICFPNLMPDLGRVEQQPPIHRFSTC
ncbi:hypothetical protein ES319_D03G024500v1 [Gossypium barbadense]|uniref:Uncharacterized protein n=1 Tax=Gossypium barbadense TaxID=3634 RepID=A0A5J5S4G0_GOSBA|nr:hypothetical protein ES319_D03G024500v1 [Gossypium barbadense]